MGRLQNKLSFAEAAPLIQDGDILLFHSTGWIAKFIRSYGGSPYSHVGVASWHENDPPMLEICEIKEFKGALSSSLENRVKLHKGYIDVYRPHKHFYTKYYNKKLQQVIEVKVKFEGKKIAHCMRQFTGLPYGYKRILYIAALKLFGVRLFVDYNNVSSDKFEDNSYRVCSTAVAECFNKIGCDLVKQKKDSYIEPSDIARSSSLDYLFTLTK